MTKIRLARFGSRGNPHYRIVVMDSRTKRDGGYIERLGYYDPRKTTKDWLKIDLERVNYWLSVGAQPTDTVKRLIKLASNQ
ncbi:MAG: 30S ribosomal protein S16 [Meiothermus sp.]|uniref:30S ribosomal protein S16 n=1 Tax=Meiothermus sp. TaxID=1955249 RepID=UPI0025CBBA4E|nr:30S ribosomal protein S16 [Meiothermus sp.]MCS7057268.1 30S ribosomal protein S16 [Meiothermus sp.]MCS7193636.1 30S ribosomal protein S16 [Meiothermus sp.]MCX7740406.1 30S ribosomal protein S16 [Meiothermus sp.]MDW8091435.1 30S ribosomal protein S16 [Meiothermus sp.]MDW8481903.1 30S ribosomal protein S16 [Meiothermus sp.]